MRFPRWTERTEILKKKRKALKSVPSDLVLVCKQVQVAPLFKAVIRSFGVHKRDRTIRVLNYE